MRNGLVVTPLVATRVVRCDEVHAVCIVWSDAVRLCTYGPMRFFFVQTRSVGLQTEAYDAMWCAHDVIRCGAPDVMRWYVVHLVLCDAHDARHCDGTRCIWYDAVLFFAQTRSIGLQTESLWSDDSSIREKPNHFRVRVKLA